MKRRVQGLGLPLSMYVMYQLTEFGPNTHLKMRQVNWTISNCLRLSVWPSVLLLLLLKIMMVPNPECLLAASTVLNILVLFQPHKVSSVIISILYMRNWLERRNNFPNITKLVSGGTGI